MADALTQKKIDALSAKRPASKREVPDGGQSGLYLIVGPRAFKWIVRYRSPATGENVKLAIGDYGPAKPKLGLHDARKAAEGTLRLVRQGQDPRDGRDTAAADLTVAEAFADFVKRYATKENKPSTVAETQAFIKREISPKWGKRRIRSITRHDIVKLIDGIAEDQLDSEGKLRQAGRPQSAVRVRALLSKAFSWFAAKGIVSENPFRDIEVPAAPRARDRVLSEDEIRWLWSATAAVGWPFGDLARLLLLTAQRRDEVAAAEWREFSIPDATWSIPPERTKNGRRQVLPLAPQVTKILAGLPRVVAPAPASVKPSEHSKVEEESPFVLSTNAETPISGYSRAKKKIDEKMLAAARKETANPELSIEPWTLHDLRRTAASGMAGLGIAVHVVEAVLNHKSGVISGVAAIYNRHDYAREKRQALEAWANRLEEIIGASSRDNVVALAARTGERA
ncbi:integrase [Mesorhizobium sp. USDA 4775]